MIFNHRNAVNISSVYYYFILVLKIVNLTRQYHFFIFYSNFDLFDIKAELFDMFKNEWCLFSSRFSSDLKIFVPAFFMNEISPMRVSSDYTTSKVILALTRYSVILFLITTAL